MSVSDSNPATRTPPVRWGRGVMLVMVLMGYIPFLNVVAIVCLIVFLPRPYCWIAPTAWLILIPPLVVHLTLAIFPLPSTDIELGSPAFLRWWFTSQWQVIFNRLPFLEECIRLIPGLYSLWLRLWGARVGRFVYWTPGVRILDRSFLVIGQQVTFGLAVRINPHIIMPDDAGRSVLRVAKVQIGDRAMIGGYSILFAGCWIAPDETTPGKREHRPFTGWRGGKRILEGCDA